MKATAIRDPRFPRAARRLRLASSPLACGQPIQHVAALWMPDDEMRVIEIVSRIALHARRSMTRRERSHTPKPRRCQ